MNSGILTQSVFVGLTACIFICLDQKNSLDNNVTNGYRDGAFSL